MNNRHPWPLKKSKSWGPFWSYLLNSTANPAHLPQKQAKRAELAVQFSWQLQNGPQDLNFFNCPGCRTFILCEIHRYLCPPKSWHNNSFLGSVPMHNSDIATRLEIKTIFSQIGFLYSCVGLLYLIWIKMPQTCLKNQLKINTFIYLYQNYIKVNICLIP